MKTSPPSSEYTACVVDNNPATINLLGVFFCSEKCTQDYYYHDFFDDNYSCFDSAQRNYCIQDVIDRAFNFLCA